MTHETWKCPDCGGLLTTDITPPVHTPQGPAYVTATGECPDCGEALSDEWTRVDDEDADEAAARTAAQQASEDRLAPYASREEADAWENL